MRNNNRVVHFYDSCYFQPIALFDINGSTDQLNVYIFLCVFYAFSWSKGLRK